MISVDYEQVVYNGNGSQTAWPYSFPIYDGDVVRLILLDADGTETDITQDYFVDVPGSTVYYPGYAPGAEPPLEDRPPKVQTGQKLIVYRDTEITQDSNLGKSWPFNVIEKGLDKLTMILQEKAFALARCLKISQGQAADIDDYDTTVPLEAGKVICGNADGNGFEAREAMMEVNGAWDSEGRQIHSVADPTATQDAVTKKYVDTLTDNNFMKLQPDGTAWEGRNLPISNVAGPASVKDAANKDYVDRILAGYAGQGERLAIFDNVAQMQAAELVPSQMAVTQGYHEPNDGGHGAYVVRAKLVGDTPNDGTIIQLANDDYVGELIVDNDTVNIKQFGAVGDGVEDDTTALVNAFATGLKVFVPNGTYLTSASLDATNDIIGSSSLNCEIRAITSIPYLLKVSGRINVFNIFINSNYLADVSVLFEGASFATIKQSNIQKARIDNITNTKNGFSAGMLIEQCLIRYAGQEYKTGTVSGNINQNTLTFSGADDLTTLGIQDGRGYIWIDDSDSIYPREIVSISASGLTVFPVLDKTITNSSYKIVWGANVHVNRFSDGNLWRFIGCNIMNGKSAGIEDMSLYGIYCASNIFQGNGVGRIVGRRSSTGQAVVYATTDIYSYHENNSLNYLYAYALRANTIIGGLGTNNGDSIAAFSGSTSPTILASAPASYIPANGITFPDTPVLSNETNILDCYQEGDWTPASNIDAIVLSAVSGSYTRIGQVVIASCAFTAPTNFNNNKAYINGLPFAQRAAAKHGGGFVSYTDSNLSLSIMLYQSTTVKITKTNGDMVSWAELSEKTIRFTFIYNA